MIRSVGAELIWVCGLRLDGVSFLCFCYFDLHLVNVGVIHCVDLVLSVLSNGVLDIPLGLCLVVFSHLLHVNHNHIYSRCFSLSVGRALVGIVAGLVTIEACGCCRGIGLAVLELGLC